MTLWNSIRDQNTLVQGQRLQKLNWIKLIGISISSHRQTVCDMHLVETVRNLHSEGDSVTRCKFPVLKCLDWWNQQLTLRVQSREKYRFTESISQIEISTISLDSKCSVLGELWNLLTKKLWGHLGSSVCWHLYGHWKVITSSQSNMTSYKKDTYVTLCKMRIHSRC